MAEHFGHERLKVYQKGMPFASMRKTLLDDLPRRVAACSDNSQRRSGMTSSSHTSSHTSSQAFRDDPARRAFVPGRRPL